MIEQILWKGSAVQINPWRERIGLPPTHLGNILALKIPFLYSFSQSVVPQPNDWPDWIHCTGYWFLDNPETAWTPPASLVDFLEKGPVVYIGFGSIVVPDPADMTRCIISAIERANIRAVLSKGWFGFFKNRSGRDKEVDVKFPDFIYPIDAVPHDWLFPRVAAVVHHGGAGTCAAGLRAGKPTVIKPFFGDQFFWADRVVDVCLV